MRPERLLAAAPLVLRFAADRCRASRSNVQPGAAPGCRTRLVFCREFELKRRMLGTHKGFSRTEYGGAPGEIRTPGLLVRSQALYPTELRARIDNNRQQYMAEREGLLAGLRLLVPRRRSGPPSLRAPASFAAASHRLVERFGFDPPLRSYRENLKKPYSLTRTCGGEGGIRTLDGLLTHTPLAGARLRPLGHLSRRATCPYQGARDDTRLEQSR